MSWLTAQLIEAHRCSTALGMSNLMLCSSMTALA